MSAWSHGDRAWWSRSDAHGWGFNREQPVIVLRPGETWTAVLAPNRDDGKPTPTRAKTALLRPRHEYMAFDMVVGTPKEQTT